MTPSPLFLKAVRESRIDISQEYRALCSELDFQKKIKHSFKQHPFRWLGGAVSAGLLTTFLGVKASSSRSIPQSSKTPSPALGAKGVANPEGAAGTLAKVGWLAGAIEVGKLLYPILRPVALEFAQKFVQGTFAKKNRPR